MRVRLLVAALALLVLFATLQAQIPVGVLVRHTSSFTEGDPPTAADATYVCTFKPPVGIGANVPEGIFTGRRVSATVTFFYKDSNHLREFSAPGSCSPGTVNAGTLVKDWGDIWSGYVLDHAGDSVPNLSFSQLMFDAVNVGMYTLYYDGYNGESNLNPSVTFTTLDNPSTGAFTTHGPWMINVGNSQTNRFIGRIPAASSFPATFLSGRSLLIGGIGVGSVNAGSSWGPVAYAPATDLDTEPAYPTTPAQSTTMLVGYSLDHKAPRDGGSDWVPHNEPGTTSVNLWSQLDGYSGSGVYIKNAVLEGLVMFTSYALEHVWYGLSTDNHTTPETQSTYTFNNTTPPTIYNSAGNFGSAGFGNYAGRGFHIAGTTGGLNDKDVFVTGVTFDTLTLDVTDTLVAQGPNAPGNIYAIGCGHSTTDNYEFATGPHSSTARKPRAFSYAASELGRVVHGDIPPYEALWDSSFDLSAIGGNFQGRAPVQGSWFDAQTGLLYVSSPEMGGPYDYLPYINVYQLRTTAPTPHNFDEFWAQMVKRQARAQKYRDRDARLAAHALSPIWPMAVFALALSPMRVRRPRIARWRRQ